MLHDKVVIAERRKQNVKHGIQTDQCDKEKKDIVEQQKHIFASAIPNAELHISPYHKLVSETLRLTLLAIINKVKLIAELKSPMAVE